MFNTIKYLALIDYNRLISNIKHVLLQYYFVNHDDLQLLSISCFLITIVTWWNAYMKKLPSIVCGWCIKIEIETWTQKNKDRNI